MGCGGEDTASISSNSSACGYGVYRNQLDAAEAFLRKHRRQIAFVTIDIGTNDVNGCVSSEHHRACRAVVRVVVADTAGLRRAAGRIRARIEIDHDGAAAQIRQPHALSVLVLQAEVGCLLTMLEHSGTL